MQDLNQLRKEVNKALAERRVAVGQVKTEKTRLAELETKQQIFLDAQQLIQTVAQSAQEQVHNAISSIVSRCLEAVFPEDPYAFNILFERKRGKTDARLVFTRGGYEFDPTEETGGGVVDVAAFGVRLASLIFSRPTRRRLLVLDEPMKHLSQEHRPAMRDLLLTLADEMGVQIVMATHSKELRVGKVIQFQK